MKYKKLQITWNYPNYYNINSDDVWEYLEDHKRHKKVKFINDYRNTLIIGIFNSARGLEEELEDRLGIEFSVEEI